MKAKLLRKISTTTLETQLTLAGIILGLMAMLVSGKAVAGDHPGVPVYPANAKPFGQSLTDWSVEYVRWFFSIPAPSPLFHVDADSCVNQSGPVWFLADTGVAPGGPEFVLTRSCTLPTGRAIYVPVLTLFSAVCPEWGVTDDELVASAHDFRALAHDIHANVDGVEISNLNEYEFITPISDITLRPDSELPTLFGGLFDCPAIQIVVIGQAIILPPLSVGEHTVRFGWTLESDECSGCGFVDITYHLTVAPR